MKKLFLLILPVGIMLTACKKEEKEMRTNQNLPQSWKTSNWVMTKSSVFIEATWCDEYRNKVTGQIVYEAREENKAINYNKTPYYTDNFGHLDCKSPGHTCYKTVIDNQPVLIIKVGASTSN